MSSVNNRRRYYLLKRLYAKDNELDSEGIWKGKQEALAGTALPVDFPLVDILTAAGYTMVEDLDGATSAELYVAGLTTHQASAVLAAFSAL